MLQNWNLEYLVTKWNFIFKRYARTNVKEKTYD